MQTPEPFNPEKPPAFEAERWLNAAGPLTLASFKGKVVVVAAFQMNCPGSNKHVLPQAKRIAAGFNDDEVAVIGLHSVFEDHAAQGPDKLARFIDEKGLSFPVAVDAPNGGDLPKTMLAYQIQGTPTLLIFDRQGRLRRHYLGQVDDLRLGAEVMALCLEAKNAPREQSIAIEQRLAMALVEPDHDHHHHEGGCCGGHHHGHDHAHAHGHEGCCGGHDHDHGHDHAPAAKDGCDGKGGCGCKH